MERRAGHYSAQLLLHARRIRCGATAGRRVPLLEEAPGARKAGTDVDPLTPLMANAHDRVGRRNS
jgi:hypothetical protein